jgi:hypothetical protein
LKIPLKSGKIEKMHFIMGDAGANSASPSFFLFPLLFLMGGALAPPGGSNMRHRCPAMRDHGE